MSDKLYYRSATLDRAKVNDKDRTVELSFSSEEEVDRGYFVEVLDHSPGSVDLARLNNNAPLLWNHDPNQQIGKIVPGSARVDKDRKGRATVIFSRSQQGEEVFQDVKDGIRTSVSVGYRLGREISKKGEAGREVKRFAFTPHEVSLVSIPADATVGVGRSESHPTKPKRQNTMTIEAEAENSVDSSKHDVKRLLAFAKHFNIGLSEVEPFINEKRSVADFQDYILRTKFNAKPTPQGPADLGMDLGAPELGKFSIVNAVRGFAENKRFDGPELEISKQAEKAFGRRALANGIIVPFEALNQTRTMTMGSATSGGFTAGVDLRPDQFVDGLRNKMVIGNLGVKTLSGLQGDLCVPRLTGDPTAYWLPETATVTDSQPTFGQLAMTPHRVAITVPISKQLIMQSSMDVEAYVRGLLQKMLALAFDKATIEGSGNSGEPLGILNTTGLGSVTYGGAATWAKVVESETVLADANADDGSIGWLTTPTVRGKWKTIQQVTGQAVFLWDPNTNKVNGYRAEATKQLSVNKTIFGNWADVTVGIWGSGLDLVVDPFTLAKSNQIQITAQMHGDVVLTRANSMVVSTDAANQ